MPGRLKNRGGFHLPIDKPGLHISCGGDERECLRLSAKTGLYGVRYVSPEDVARCVEAFNACIHGTLHGGNPVPPVSTSPGGSTRKALPAHLGIPYYGDADIDCRLSGVAVNCKASRGPNLPLVSETLEITGTLSGLTMMGTYTSRVEVGGFRLQLCHRHFGASNSRLHPRRDCGGA